MRLRLDRQRHRAGTDRGHSRARPRRARPHPHSRAGPRDRDAGSGRGRHRKEATIMKTIHHVFDIAAPAGEVFGALSTGEGLASWWTNEVQADTTVGGSVRFTFADNFNPQMRIEELAAPGTVRWACVGGHDPWLDNRFDFEIEATEAGARLRFWQHYARELSDAASG